MKTLPYKKTKVAAPPPPPAPKPPPCRRIRDGFIGICKCGSCKYSSFIVNPFKQNIKNKCIQPNCENYYKGFPSEDYDPEYAAFVNGKMDSFY